MDAFTKLQEIGQSLWYDNIERKILENGEFAQLVHCGEIRGVTSNPSIFNNAISRSTDYDSALKPMAWSGWNAEQIFNQLAIEDIRMAADILLPLYEKTRGGDGYVSLEVNPRLANNTQETLSEVRHLWERVQRPNLMIKIPATPEGIPAVKSAIAEGFNVNVTLIFSLQRYKEVINAYLDGLEERVAAGLPIESIASVASFFVSRLDSKVDAKLNALLQAKSPDGEKAAQLLGKAAVANARMAYKIFNKTLQTPRFQTLKEKGARVQRPLWASTSTKNPSYLDVLYVNELIGPNTINTVPPQTLNAFRDHGIAQNTLEEDADLSETTIRKIESLGISLDQITQELEIEGVKSFKDAFESLLASIDDRRQKAIAELGSLRDRIPARVTGLKDNATVARLFEKDATLWTADKKGQEEIAIRLGWLTAPQTGAALLPDLETLMMECQQEGLTNALLLGMGGSSLAPEVLAMTFGVRESNGKLGLQLNIVDTTDPDQILAASKIAPIEKTLYIVASKSGTTGEVDALFRYFFQRAQSKLGNQAGSHFIAITDPGTPLEKMAKANDFRRVILADPEVGGRYSALTAFGLVPAILLGLDGTRLLEHAAWMADQCQPEIPEERNPGLVLGAILGEATLQGKDKLTLLADPEISAFGSWLEQLVAESSGKQEKGIIPVDLEPIIDPSFYEQDRLFIYLSRSGALEDKVAKLLKAGHPVINLPVPSEYDIAAEFYRWEIVIAIACSILGVNAFDQPDVQDSKTRTVNKIADYKKTGQLAEIQSVFPNNEGIKLSLFPENQVNHSSSVKQMFFDYLDSAKEGDYIAINAYVPRNRQTLSRLQKLRAAVHKATKKAVTLGFGPRYLHSTGQLHKGGPKSGLFIQITCTHSQTVEIPGQDLTFETLQLAQAQGDLEALQARNRRVLYIHTAHSDLHDLIEELGL